VSKNLDLVRSIYEDWGRGDYSSAEWAHPEIEWVFADGPAPGRWTGIAAAGEAWHDFLTAWEDYRPEVHEYRELDDGCVLVLVQHVGRGKASGVSTEGMKTPGANVFEFRSGTVTRLALYWNRERALADLGLAE
jgi:ketosteroid isomerase-like protein